MQFGVLQDSIKQKDEYLCVVCEMTWCNKSQKKYNQQIFVENVYTRQ
jgi:hypothetical protein